MNRTINQSLGKLSHDNNLDERKTNNEKPPSKQGNYTNQLTPVRSEKKFYTNKNSISIADPDPDFSSLNQDNMFKSNQNIKVSNGKHIKNIRTDRP